MELSKSYHYLFTELADERISNWFLMSSPIPLLLIEAAYLYFVLSLGPRLMKNRVPFELKYTIIFYNLFQVLANLWIFIESLDGAWLYNYSWKCEPIDRSRSPLAMRAVRGIYVYFLVKVCELLDTIFFVLRKKNKQVTFLHVYHHVFMALGTWIIAKYVPGGHELFTGFVNSFVHIVMYSYYLIAALGPKYHKYLWWKKYITIMQLIQFGMILWHSSQLLIYDCDYPKWTLVLSLPNAVFFAVLFNDFYYRSYNNINQNECAVKHKSGIADTIGNVDNKESEKTL